MDERCRAARAVGVATGDQHTRRWMMTAPKHNLVVGVFDHLPPAEQAIQDLWQAGFAHDRIDMVTRSQGVTEGTPRFERDKDAATGALTGAAAGAATGVV